MPQNTITKPLPNLEFFLAALKLEEITLHLLFSLTDTFVCLELDWMLGGIIIRFVMPAMLCFMSMCLKATSTEFLDKFRPNPAPALPSF